MTYPAVPPVAQQSRANSPSPRSRARWIAFGVVLVLALLIGVPAYLTVALIRGPAQQMVRTIQDLSQTDPLPVDYHWLVGEWTAAGGDTIRIERDSEISYRFGSQSGKTYLFVEPGGKSARVAGGDFRIELRRSPSKD